MPVAIPERPEEYTVEQWDAACAAARRKWPTEWENPPYAGKTNPDGWRFSQCYAKALQMFPEVVVDLNPSEGPRDIPKDTVDLIYQMPITEGMKMVDFHGEYGHGRYYPLEVYTALKTPRLNPVTREPIKEEDVIQYTAHIVPKAGGLRTKRTKRTKRTRRTRSLRKRFQGK